MMTLQRMGDRGPMVRVIVDPRDASKDKWMDKKEAAQQYQEGKLAIDVTNGCYTCITTCRTAGQ